MSSHSSFICSKLSLVADVRELPEATKSASHRNGYEAAYIYIYAFLTTKCGILQPSLKMMIMAEASTQLPIKMQI